MLIFNREKCEEKEAWRLLSYTHYDLALCDITLSEYDRSIALFRKSREGFEKYGVKQKTANTYCMEGAVYIYKGEFGPALELLVDCHGRMVELDNKVGIMDNLLSNALKFSPAKSIVRVNLSSANGQYRLKVIDQGPGFSEEDKSKMFRKFQKLSARPTGGENSTGLGLSIIKVLTEKLRGDVELISEKGKGATFNIVLPRLYE